MITSEILAEVLTIILAALSIFLVAFMHSTHKQQEPAQNDKQGLIGLRQGEGIPNAK